MYLWFELLFLKRNGNVMQETG